MTSNLNQRPSTAPETALFVFCIHRGIYKECPLYRCPYPHPCSCRTTFVPETNTGKNTSKEIKGKLP